MTTYYIKQNDTIVLSDSDKQRLINTLEFMPDYKDLEIQETENLIKDGVLYTEEEYEAEQVSEKKEQFNSEFFSTSLGYIRRKVTMKTGETKDFLSDLLPVISLGIQSGQEVTIITYNEPDLSQNLTTEYMESLQEVKNVTSDFIQECFLQLSNDFIGG